MLSLSLGAGIATVACSSLSSGFPNVRCWFRLLGLFSDDIARFRHFLPCVFANVMAQKTAEKLQRTLTRHSFLKKHFPTVTLSETQSLPLTISKSTKITQTHIHTSSTTTNYNQDVQVLPSPYRPRRHYRHLCIRPKAPASSKASNTVPSGCVSDDSRCYPYHFFQQ